MCKRIQSITDLHLPCLNPNNLINGIRLIVSLSLSLSIHNKKYILFRHYFSDDAASSGNSGDSKNGRDNKNGGNSKKGGGNKNDGGDNNNKSYPPPPPMFSTVNKGGGHPESSAFGALAQIAVPENYPTVPVIPLYRNPVFPKFVKLVEVKQILVFFYI